MSTLPPDVAWGLRYKNSFEVTEPRHDQKWGRLTAGPAFAVCSERRTVYMHSASDEARVACYSLDTGECLKDSVFECRTRGDDINGDGKDKPVIALSLLHQTLLVARYTFHDIESWYCGVTGFEVLKVCPDTGAVLGTLFETPSAHLLHLSADSATRHDYNVRVPCRRKYVRSHTRQRACMHFNTKWHCCTHTAAQPAMPS